MKKSLTVSADAVEKTNRLMQTSARKRHLLATEVKNWLILEHELDGENAIRRPCDEYYPDIFAGVQPRHAAKSDFHSCHSHIVRLTSP